MAKLTASDAWPQDLLGISVAIYGDTVLIGSRWDDDGGSASGSAYLFLTTDGGATYAQLAKLTAPDAAAKDMFGWSVAIDGETVVATAPYVDDAGANSGSAYVFATPYGSALRAHDGTTADREYDCIPRDIGCVKVNFEFPSSLYAVSDPKLQAGYEVTVAGEPPLGQRAPGADRLPHVLRLRRQDRGRADAGADDLSLPTPVPTSLPTPRPLAADRLRAHVAPTPAPSPSPATVLTAAPTRAPTAAPSAARPTDVPVALEIRFDVTYCEVRRHRLITFPDGRRRHGRRRVGDDQRDDHHGDPEPARGPGELQRRVLPSGIRRAAPPFPTLLSVTYLPDADAWPPPARRPRRSRRRRATGVKPTTALPRPPRAGRVRTGSFPGTGLMSPTVCTRPRGTTAATPRTSGPPPRRIAWMRSHPTRCQDPDSGFNDAGQVAYKTEWRETDLGEEFGSCAGGSWAAATAAPPPTTLRCRPASTPELNPGGHQSPSKTSRQYVETELNEGLGGGTSAAAAPAHCVRRPPAANLTVEISADTGGTETSISHEFTGAASEEEHTWCVENGEIVFLPTAAPTIAVPTAAPSSAPTSTPTRVPTTPPSSAPTLPPTPEPTSHPTIVPTSFPALDCPAARRSC